MLVAFSHIFVADTKIISDIISRDINYNNKYQLMKDIIKCF